jgi:hypothetical protein
MSNGLTSRTAVYGPVRTVVWQGSAGNRCPYADQVRIWEAYRFRRIDRVKTPITETKSDKSSTGLNACPRGPAHRPNRLSQKRTEPLTRFVEQNFQQNQLLTVQRNRHLGIRLRQWGQNDFLAHRIPPGKRRDAWRPRATAT